MRGQFRIWLPDGEIVLPNRITDEGEIAFLKMIGQAATADVSAGGNFYIGLCNQAPNDEDTLADISTEPSGTGGYARQAIARSAVGWPTVTTVNGHNVIRTATVTFTASGADFSASFTRAFLTNVSSGTSGKLLAISGALTAALLVTNGNSFPMAYELSLS